MITFKNYGMFINPSRAAPASVKMAASEYSRSNVSYALLAGSQNSFGYAVFTSVIAIANSNIHDDNPTSTFRQISGTLCTQEWQRFCAFFCMVFKEKELHAQIYDDAITFSTRAKPNNRSDDGM
jgi:hypothetical protein